MFDLVSDDMRRDPFPLYAHLRSAAPVFSPPGSGLWLLLDHESVKRALGDPATFSSAVMLPTGKAPDWLSFSDPPRHTKMRALIMRAFTPRSVALLEPRVRELANELLDEHIESGEMDLAVDYAGPLPMLVIAEMVGMPADDRAMLMRWSEVIMDLSHAVAGGATAARAIEAHAAAKEEMQDYLDRLTAQRRAAPRDDLLTRLVEAEVDGEHLTPSDILGFFQLLLAAGTETTTNLIDNTVLCLCEHPDQRARLAGAPELLTSAIEEVLRYRTPAQMVFRQTLRAVEMHGQHIPAGQFVIAVTGAANRDPKVFVEPDRFDIARDPNPHIAFGHGIHFCIGAALSRLEGRVAVGELLRRAPDLRLASEAPWQPRRALIAHGPVHLPICFAPGPRGG